MPQIGPESQSLYVMIFMKFGTSDSMKSPQGVSFARAWQAYNHPQKGVWAAQAAQKSRRRSAPYVLRPSSLSG